MRSLWVKLAALAVSGGVALAMFGGGAVHTDFSKSTSAQISATAATFDLSLTGGSDGSGNISCTNLVPGVNSSTTGTWAGDYCASTITLNDGGSVPEVFTLTIGAPNVSSTDAANVEVTIGGIGNTLAAVDNAQYTWSLGTVNVGSPANVSVEVDLLSGAGNNWAGFTLTIPYTVTAEAGV
ncbi:MAG TPA: hypothetical protein VME46_20720 [Acidimicrobiales bacterium]|nr:hypothetical protein [Acidimicrobiales bacterium]